MKRFLIRNLGPLSVWLGVGILVTYFLGTVGIAAALVVFGIFQAVL